jgi:hypothetical protein
MEWTHTVRLVQCILIISLCCENVKILILNFSLPESPLVAVPF